MVLFIRLRICWRSGACGAKVEKASPFSTLRSG
jgi:hypothetical protein